jgi:hypothetical protein
LFFLAGTICSSVFFLNPCCNVIRRLPSCTLWYVLFPFYSFLLCESPCHARLHLLLRTSMLCAVLRPFSFSSRFMRVTAAARPIDTAKMGSRLLICGLELHLEPLKNCDELGYDVLVRHARQLHRFQQIRNGGRLCRGVGRAWTSRSSRASLCSILTYDD